MKVSLITVVYNAEKYIKDCMESVIAQDYKDLEYIVVDGGSTDLTLSIITDYRDKISHFISEKDQGIYDAINKGIKMASGDVVGILNADDMLASSDVIAKIASYFQSLHPDAVYGNLNYVNATNIRKISRKWVSKQFVRRDIEKGWMPAHPTFYAKRELFRKYGNYSLDFGTAADYELMLRFLYQHQINAKFVDYLIVNMRVGGVSNSSIKQRYLALKNDYKAIRTSNLPFPIATLVMKKLSKISQFLH